MYRTQLGIHVHPSSLHLVFIIDVFRHPSCHRSYTTMAHSFSHARSSALNYGDDHGIPDTPRAPGAFYIPPPFIIHRARIPFIQCGDPNVIQDLPPPTGVATSPCDPVDREEAPRPTHADVIASSDSAAPPNPAILTVYHPSIYPIQTVLQSEPQTWDPRELWTTSDDGSLNRPEAFGRCVDSVSEVSTGQSRDDAVDLAKDCWLTVAPTGFTSSSPIGLFFPSILLCVAPCHGVWQLTPRSAGNSASYVVAGEMGGLVRGSLGHWPRSSPSTLPTNSLCSRRQHGISRNLQPLSGAWVVKVACDGDQRVPGPRADGDTSYQRERTESRCPKVPSQQRRGAVVDFP